MSIIAVLSITWVVAAAVLALVWWNRAAIGWQFTTYVVTTLLLLAIGLTLVETTYSPWIYHTVTVQYVFGAFSVALGGIGLLLGGVEFGLLRLMGQFRLGAISRVTYYEALLQPFTLIILASGISAISIAARVSYFTYDEDFKMYNDIATSFIFLFTLPIMVFASTKVIDEEIENRTMLTLMSKPVSRWQVVLGKYLGVLLLVFVAVVSLGIIVGVCGYMRYYDDMTVDYRVTGNDAGLIWKLDFVNIKAMMALMPSVVLTFLQVATLAAISVAVSTRFGLAVNVTTVVVIYMAANLARYAQSMTDIPQPFGAISGLLTYVLPGLGLLDLNQRLIFGNYLLGKQDWANNGGSLPSYGAIWQYVGISCVYAVFYIGAALSFGMALFRSRELT